MPVQQVLLQPPLGEMDRHDHHVSVYSTDDELAELLHSFVAAGFRAGEGVAVIATSEHLRMLQDRLEAAGIDLRTLRAQDQYFAIDAEVALAQFMIKGRPDRRRFNAYIGLLLQAASAGGRPVRAFGEMVVLLWRRGNRKATVELEALWEQVCAREDLRLLCAYPQDVMAEGVPEIAQILDLHTNCSA